MSLKLNYMKSRCKMNKNVKFVGVVNDGQMFAANDNSAFCLKSQYTREVYPFEVMPSLHDALTLLQTLFDNKEINLAAFLVLCSCIKSLETETKTVRFKRSAKVETLDLPALIASAKSQYGFTVKGKTK